MILRMRKVPDKSCRENQNTHFVFKSFFFRTSGRLRDNVEKHCRAGQATDGNTIWRLCFACWINKANRHTLEICNTYCFSMARMDMRTLLNITIIRALPLLLMLVSTFGSTDPMNPEGRRCAVCIASVRP
jgi:hypothetical protein